MVVNGQKISLISVILLLLVFSCKQDNKKSAKQKEKASQIEKPVIKVPEFNQDSAFHYVKTQTEFGPRVPNTEAHKKCGDYFVSFFNRNGAKVIEQNFKTRAFNGDVLNGRNIIASYNPQNKNRVLLCAHWDSRPFADWDDDEANHYKPIDGANDGASGVGVLMEIARQLNINNTKLGIDIVLFDAEDYGEHRKERGKSNMTDSWALGSQYWAKNLHKPAYRAKYGILLDMVGAEDARFTKEYYSMMFAPAIVNDVWSTAKSLGYNNYFINSEEGSIIDDHYYVNKYAKIPTINIIHTENSRTGFFEHWHTVNDNIENISPFTLKVVGEVVLKHIYYN